MAHDLLRTLRLRMPPVLLMLLLTAPAPAHIPGKIAADSVATKTPSGPRFRGGDMLAFRRWVMARFDFPADRYTEGERIRLMVQFALTKSGKTREVELRKPSDDPVDGKVLAIVGKSDGWTPGTASDLIPGAKHLLTLDILLRENPDGTLRADDHLVYGKADTMPRFEGMRSACVPRVDRAVRDATHAAVCRCGSGAVRDRKGRFDVRSGSKGRRWS